MMPLMWQSLEQLDRDLRTAVENAPPESIRKALNRKKQIMLKGGRRGEPTRKVDGRGT